MLNLLKVHIFFDVDNNEFIDYLMALGPITLGYNYQFVNQAVMEQLQDVVLTSNIENLEFNIKKILNDKNILNQLQKNLFNFLDNQNNISEKDSNSIIDKIIN
jgi:acetylornithine/succinyldiaminopimelate/putrescine aminotransferase